MGFQQPANSACSLVTFPNSDLVKQYELYEECCRGCMGSQTALEFSEIMVYIYGGGFVALSSETMETYTRKWANQLKIPVFLITYRKPPGHPFLVPVYDCFSAYIFIVEQIHRYMNIRPRKVIRAGDSIGGNLSCAVISLLLKANSHRSRMGLSRGRHAGQLHPSKLNALNDAILLPSLLLFVP